MSDDWILGSGPASAKLMLIGEAPGKTEAELRKPFVGAFGELVTEMLETAGINRQSIYVTNVVKVRPPANKLDRLEELGYKIEDFIPLLKKEIEAVQPNCILALGALALNTLTGKTGIRDYRGSILTYTDLPIKVVPTIHPAALFRGYGEAMYSWKQKAQIQFDFRKAAEQSEFPELKTPRRTLSVIRSTLDFHNFLRAYTPHHEIVYCDTEVYKAHLLCIGFAFTPYEGVSIPLLDLQSNKNPRGIPLHELVALWKMVDEFLRSDIKVVGQNFKADKVYWIEESGLWVENFYYDTMFKFHTLSPELPKGLAFQASILTEEPFWKSEGKEFNPHKDRIDVFCLYNAKDCVMNCECDLAMNKDLKELGLEDFFYNFVTPAYPIYEHIEKTGLKVDFEVRKELKSRYLALWEERQTELDELMGYHLNVMANNKGGQVHTALFQDLKLPKRVKVDDDTLASLRAKIKDERKNRVLTLIPEIRTIRKMIGTYIEAEPDWDGFMRCSYNQVGTETGRTSTSIIQKPLRASKWGIPFQTVPKHGEFGEDIQSMFVPDKPGYIFVEFDQSQAEARVVALLAEDYELLELFDKIDVHKLTASYIYNCSEDDVDKNQRHIGKQARHGLAYDEQAKTLAFKSGISEYRAAKAFEAVHKMSPNIENVFHEGIQNALAELGKVLYTPFGRRREFLERWGRDLFKEAYAHIPQSTVGDNTKRAMIALWNKGIDWIRDFRMEKHDSFVVLIPEGRLEEYYWIVKPIFEKPIDFSRCSLPRGELVIPVDCQIGYNLRDMEKWKP